MLRLARVLTLVGGLMSLAQIAVAEDWPTWRHDRLRSGVTNEKLRLPLVQGWTFRSHQAALAPKPTESPLRISYPQCSQFSLPMIAAGDAVFFSSAADGRVVCLEAATGKKRWEFLAGAAVNRTPMFWEGRIYAGSDDGYVYCLDAKTGSVIWRYCAAPADRQFLAYGKMISVWPIRTDVLVDEGVAYFSAGIFPHEGTFVYALDAKTGKLLWRNGSQCENGYQLSLAPGGHLYVTGKDIWIPKDFRGYSKPYYGSPTPFRRSDGAFINGFGSSIEQDPERPKIKGQGWNNLFWPLMGVEKNGVRYAGDIAWKVENEEKARQAVWQKRIPGRWVDFDSGVGVHGKRDVTFRYDPDLSTVVYAGGVIFHSAFELDPKKGVGSAIYAREAKTGKVLWTAELPERANQLLVAGGRLLVGTRRGTIYCFTPQGTAAKNLKNGGLITESINKSPYGDGNPKLAQAAATMIVQSKVTQSKITQGYAVVLDCQSGQLAYELARRTGLSICAVFSDAKAEAEARRKYSSANLYLSRITTLLVPKDADLPFPSFFADLIVSEGGVLGGPLPGNLAEIERIQKPIRGVALFGGNQNRKATILWTSNTKQAGWETVDAGAVRWVKRIRPPLIDGGSWTHMFGDAGNTGCSHDGVLKSPLGVLWYGAPHIQQPGNHTSLILDGVLVVPQPNALEACDQYTGRRLWRIDSGSIGVSIAAGGKFIFSKFGKTITQIDLHSGKMIVSYATPFGKEHGWGWFAVSQDGKTLFGAAAGGLFATETESGQGHIRWQLGGPKQEEKARIGGLTAVNGDRLFVLGGKASDAQRSDAIAQMRGWMKTQTKELREEFESQIKDRDIRELIAIDTKTGKILYRRGVDVSNCGGTWLRPAGRGYGSKRHYNPGVGMGMYVHKGVVVIASESSADKGWGMWRGGAYKARATTAYDGATGKLLWYKFTNHRTRPVIIDNTVHAEPWAFDLRTGKKRQRLHPITGEVADWAWCRADKQCGIFSASKYFLFGRNKGFGYQDLLNDDGLYTFWHSRSNCLVDHVSGGGLMIKPPQAIYCNCQWSLPFTVAMGQVRTLPAAAPQFAQPGATLPVKHLNLDFGGNGDRRDQQGKLWLKSVRPAAHLLLLGYDLQMIRHEGAEDIRRSAHFTQIEGEKIAPFVFSTAIVGLKRCVLPVARPHDEPATYRVRLGFAALPGDKPGQRLFDVRLNEKTVLKDFDIVTEAGETNRAVWKEFTLKLKQELVLDMIPKTDSADPQKLPVICALQIIRNETNVVTMIALKSDLWINHAKPMKTATFEFSNHGEKRFQGRIEFKTPPGVTVTPIGSAEIVLEPKSRREWTVQIRGDKKTQPGRHSILSKLIDKDGKIIAQKNLVIEWLGDLQRRILSGGSASVRQTALQKIWSAQVTPHGLREHLHISDGFRAPDDGGAARGYVWFHIPEELRGKVIRRARLRLSVATTPGLILQVAGLPGQSSRDSVKPGAAKGGPTLKRLVGPPWPDFNKVTYEAAPAVLPKFASLNSMTKDGVTVLGDVPGPLKFTKEQPNIYLAIEQQGSPGVVFWSHQAPDRTLAPVLILDYLP